MEKSERNKISLAVLKRRGRRNDIGGRRVVDFEEGHKPDYIVLFERRHDMAIRRARFIATGVGNTSIDGLPIDDIFATSDALLAFLRNEQSIFLADRLKRAFAFASDPALPLEAMVSLTTGLNQIVNEAGEEIANEVRASEEYQSANEKAKEWLV